MQILSSILDMTKIVIDDFIRIQIMVDKYLVSTYLIYSKMDCNLRVPRYDHAFSALHHLKRAKKQNAPIILK